MYLAMWGGIIPYKISPCFQLFFLLKFLKIMLGKGNSLPSNKLCCCLSLLLGHYVRLSVTPRATAYQASLCFSVSRSLLRLMPIELVMPFNYLILCKVSDTTEHWSTVNFEYRWRSSHSLAI